jgi:hypothetical protein
MLLIRSVRWSRLHRECADHEQLFVWIVCLFLFLVDCWSARGIEGNIARYKTPQPPVVV